MLLSCYWDTDDVPAALGAVTSTVVVSGKSAQYSEVKAKTFSLGLM